MLAISTQKLGLLSVNTEIFSISSDPSFAQHTLPKRQKGEIILSSQEKNGYVTEVKYACKVVESHLIV